MSKSKTARFCLIASVVLLSLLADFSVLGAFAGAERARLFFNSLPLVVFWCVLLLLLAAGFFVFPGLRKRKMLLLIHAGLVLVLAGGMYGSQGGHAVFNRFRQTPRLVGGSMVIPKGHTFDTVSFDDGQAFELPFAVHLKDASVEYYDQSRMVKAYRGVLEVIDNGKVVKTAELKVNQPLYYRGYHFYLDTFSARGSTLLIDLMVVSAQGVWLVFAGYAMILIGVFGHFGRAAFAHRPVQEGVQ